MGVAENIAALLAKFQISQNGFASSIQVSAPTVSRWCSGSMRMRHSTLERICTTYNLVPDDILSDARGLAAQMFGTHICSPTIPLVAAHDIGAFLAHGPVHLLSRIEVTSKLIDRHPNAFAFVLAADGATAGIPANSHVVIDPSVTPRDGSVVVVVAQARARAELQRFKLAETSRKPDIVGTVVWFQAAELLR